MAAPSLTFDTDGWRAVMDEQFTEENVIRTAQAFVRYRQSQPADTPELVAIGYDGRRSSRQYAALFADVLSSYGVRALLSTAIIPTPVLVYAVKHRSCCAGVMITASHRPPRYNGVNFTTAYGAPFPFEATQQIEAQVEPIAEPFAPRSECISLTDFLPEYIAQLRTLVDFDLLSAYGADPRNHAAVIIDSMGGAGETLLEDLLEPCGWRAQTIFGAADANFYDRIPEPVSEHLEPLKYNVRVTDTLFGIATDGDADGCGVVYDDGEWMSAQETSLALGWYLREKKRRQGVSLPAAPEADPLRDGILSGLFFAEMIAASGRSLHAIVDAIRGGNV